MSKVVPNKADKCKGAMLATAIGDALGWPNEQRSRNINKSLEARDNFVEWTRRNNKPCHHDEKILPGEYSDDTQLTLSIARSIITGNWEKFFKEKEFPFWMNYERGGGGALLKAARSYKKGVLPWKSGYARDYFNAGGNGAVMRILPHIISHTGKLSNIDLMNDIVRDAIITHGHPRAILGATCYAFALEYLLRKETVLEYGELVSAVIDGREIWGMSITNYYIEEWIDSAKEYSGYNYIDEWNQVLCTMIDKLKFIQTSLKRGLLLKDTDILTHIGCFSKENGAGDIAILAAIYFASRYANNPILGIKIPAFAIGIDTDTIASITGGLLGMLSGTKWIPEQWKMVQDYECLSRITDILLADDKQQISRMYMIDDKSKTFEWNSSPIGRIRKSGIANVLSGKCGMITIIKYQSVLGQTFYIKEVHKTDHCTYSSVEQNQANDINKKNVRSSFVLNATDIDDMLNNPNFKKNITVGKVIKVIDALINSNQTSESISKKLDIDCTMVNLIRNYIKNKV